MRFVAIAVVLVPGLALAGPTKHVGKELTKGVEEQLAKDNKGAEETSREISHGAVEGVSPRDARKLTREMVGGVGDEVVDFLECGNKNRMRCLEERLSQLTYAAARGTAQGARSAASPWGLVLSFVLGASTALLAVALGFLLAGQRRQGRQLTRLVEQPT